MSKTILLVDDDVDLLDSVSEVLRTRGYFVSEHSDPREALEYCRPKEDLNCVVTEDGEDVEVAEVRRIHPTVEELLMTGNLLWWGPASSDGPDCVEESFSYAELFQVDDDTLVS